MCRRCYLPAVPENQFGRRGVVGDRSACRPKSDVLLCRVIFIHFGWYVNNVNDDAMYISQHISMLVSCSGYCIY